MIAEKENVLHQVSGHETLWSRVNTAESIVGVQTPLSWSFWDDGGELGFRQAYCELGFLPRSALQIPDRVEEKFTAIFYGRAATNVSAFRSALDAMPFSATEDAERNFFSSGSTELRDQSPRRRRMAAALRLPVAALGLPRRLQKLRADSAAFWRDSMDSLPHEDGPAAARRLEQALRRFSAEVAAQIVASTVSTFFSGRIQGLIRRQAATLEGRAESLELRLLGGFGDMEEIQVSADLWQVARGDRSLSDFLARHGFRGPADGELSSRSWREEAKPIEALLEPYRALSESQNPVAAERRRIQDREAATREVLAGLGAVERLRASTLLRLGARFIPLRVIAKAAFQQTFDVARGSARRIGTLLAGDGRLGAVDDVFYLLRGELVDPPPDARERVESRRALRESYQALDLPLEFTGVPEPFPLFAGDESRSTDPLEGLGVSPGVVEGVARVVRDPSDEALRQGEILVCNTTDPSWTSYFLIAAGVVIDVGGPLSHGAIVARELGIPCVINTVDGTRRLRSGDRLRIDGSGGRVEILS